MSARDTTISFCGSNVKIPANLVVSDKDYKIFLNIMLDNLSSKGKDFFNNEEEKKIFDSIIKKMKDENYPECNIPVETFTENSINITNFSQNFRNLLQNYNPRARLEVQLIEGKKVKKSKNSRGQTRKKLPSLYVFTIM